MASVAIVIVILGIVLIGLGTVLALLDWKRKRDAETQALIEKGEAVSAEEASLGEMLEGLAKLADALKGYPLGMQFVVWGIVLIIIGGIFGGVAGLQAA